MDIETIDGYDIPKRELTEEEATRELSYERFSNYGFDAGEDFLDQHEHLINNDVFFGWMLSKCPENKEKILNAINKKQSIAKIFNYMNTVQEHLECYTYLAEFVNLTILLKKNINQILIQIEEYYGTR